MNDKNNKIIFSLAVLSLILIIIAVIVFSPRRSPDKKARLLESNTTNEDKVLNKTSPNKSKSIIPPTQSSEELNVNEVRKNDAYPYSIDEDKKNFDPKHVDIVVGDKLYATQINNWYSNFDEVKNKTVQIDGFLVDEFKPYYYIGRNGPSCPFCNGSYVSFEINTNEDLKKIKPLKDWIRVYGILREGTNKEFGPFYYIEVLKLEKLNKKGLNPVID